MPWGFLDLETVMIAVFGANDVPVPNPDHGFLSGRAYKKKRASMVVYINRAHLPCMKPPGGGHKKYKNTRNISAFIFATSVSDPALNST